MTSEVAILNKQAVALAADSAVTTDGGYGQKIFNTVNKLFTLSKYHPVGIMVYSSAEVMGVPIETVIKTFRNELDTQLYPTLHEYYDRFVSFLQQDAALFPESERFEHCRQVVGSNLLDLYNRIMRTLYSEYPGWQGPSSRKVRETARTLLQEHHARIHTSPLLPGTTAAAKRAIRAELPVDQWQTDFKNTFGLANRDLRLIQELAFDLICRQARTGVETGFVIAGFGDEEAFPQLQSFEFECSVQGVHKLRHLTSVNARDGAAVVPFAQPDMIETFVEGRAARLDDFLLQLIDRYFIEEKQRAAQNPALQAQLAVIHGFLDSLNQSLQRKFAEGLREFTDEYHIKPVLATVSSLPKEELAIMAEALINLTAIKRRMSPDAETVGGPTDVAVISKGDGFVWIKRKHYFDANLNPGFSHNYFRKEKQK